MNGLRPPLLATHDLHKAYGGVRAVDGVSLALSEGEIVGLVGANGAGKSTLIKLIAGAIRPDGGTIEIDGRPVAFTRPKDAIAAGVALVPQELNLVEDLPVAENVLLGRLPRRGGVLRTRRMLARAAQALAVVDAERRIDLRANTAKLTPVQHRLVTIARAIAQDARLLILDEPTAALPTDTADTVLEVVERLAKTGTAIIWVSHRLAEIERLSHRVVAMRNGTMVANLPGSEADRPTLVSLISGERQETTIKAIGPGGKGSTLVAAKQLGGIRVADVDLEVRAGEIVGIAGLQGAGRSELLRLLTGIQPLTSGSVQLLGAGPARSMHQAARRGVGYIAEGRGRMALHGIDVLGNFTASALSDIGMARTVVTRAMERSRSSSTWERLRVKGQPELPIGSLSGGNQQKVFLGRWLLKGVRLLILDEPTAGVDVGARAEFHELLRSLADEGVGVIMASAEPEEISLVCHRAVVLVEGRVAHELIQPMEPQQVVAASYLGR